MKNTIKLFGIIAVAALIGLSVTSCDEEYTATFINETRWDIAVVCAGSDPSSFTLKGVTLAEPASTQLVTRVGKLVEITSWDSANKNMIITENKGDGRFVFKQDPDTMDSVQK
jgi:hypothetical protein